MAPIQVLVNLLTKSHELSSALAGQAHRPSRRAAVVATGQWPGMFVILVLQDLLTEGTLGNSLQMRGSTKKVSGHSGMSKKFQHVTTYKLQNVIPPIFGNSSNPKLYGPWLRMLFRRVFFSWRT